jgi:hypothetical protein
MTKLIGFASRAADRKADQSRRDFLTRFTLAATALVVAPLSFILRPTTAYAAVCGPASGCNDGYTAFCCSINRGINSCPPGHFVGGWWKASGSSYCLVDGQPSARYYIDCHPRCSCECSGGSGFCDPSCWSCSCHCPSTGTCDERHVCCAIFRYGQCNTDIACSGPVTCRVVTCVPPYQLFDSCSPTLRTDNFTANQTAPCLAGQP